MGNLTLGLSKGLARVMTLRFSKVKFLGLSMGLARVVAQRFPKVRYHLQDCEADQCWQSTWAGAWPGVLPSQIPGQVLGRQNHTDTPRLELCILVSMRIPGKSQSSLLAWSRSLRHTTTCASSTLGAWPSSIPPQMALSRPRALRYELLVDRNSIQCRLSLHGLAAH